MAMAGDAGRDILAAQRAILAWAASHLRYYPWRKRLDDPYAVLVAEILLKRTTATAAARVYAEFLRQFPNLNAIVDSSEGELSAALAQVGLQKQRARAMRSLAIHLCNRSGGAIPNQLDQLLAVPSLGEYSARAILSFAFDVPMAVLDSNVERILTRVFRNRLPTRPTRRALQELADCLLPRESHRTFNFALLDLGALVCRYVDPRCGECPLRDQCDYFGQHGPMEVRERRAIYGISVSSMVRQLRQARGLSLVRLARESGVSKLTIIRLESGMSKPRDDTLRKLAEVLNVEMEELR